MKIIVIGGGAAGMAAAIQAARRGGDVTLLEKMDRVGKKLLATGNGRCNLMNVSQGEYPGGAVLAHAVLSQCGVKEQTDFWHGLGLQLRVEDGGRVYPASGQASSVLDALRMALDCLDVQVMTQTAATDIRQERFGFSVITAKGACLHCDRVIATAGGCAQPKLGSDGSLWPVLNRLGHTLVKPRPALTQIMTDTAPIKGMAGIRVKAEVAVMRHGHVLHWECGEVLFADYGLSGVCVMQCARFAEKGSTLRLNLLHGMGFDTRQQARAELLRRKAEWAAQPMERLMTGLCVPRLAACLCTAAGIRLRDRAIGSLTEAEADALAQAMTAFDLTVKGVKDFSTAQVTAGGLDISQFQPETMASTMVPGLYAAGEILDVDGTCGGYNLMFAFGSGMLAGKACMEEPV